MFWNIIGILLLLGIFKDMRKGQTWLHKPFRRSTNPLVFWLLITFYLMLALSCFTIVITPA